MRGRPPTRAPAATKSRSASRAFSSGSSLRTLLGLRIGLRSTEPEKVGVLFLRVLVRAMPRSGIPTTGTTLPGLQLRRALRCQRCGATPPGRAGASTGEPQARESAVREDRDRADCVSLSHGPPEEEASRAAVVKNRDRGKRGA